MIVGTLAACGSSPRIVDAPSQAPLPQIGQSYPPLVVPQDGPATTMNFPGDNAPLPAAIQQGKSRWIPVRWSEIPGIGDDAMNEAWNAWIKNCERPTAVFAALCREVRPLSIASADEQRNWMVARLQPYRVESAGNAQAPAEGMLTGYYEPIFDATRNPVGAYNVALYRPPASLGSRKPWFTRQEIDTSSQAQAELRGREIAYMSDAIDMLVMQIQGSGRLRITEADGSQRLVRVAFAGSNDQPYRSVNNWLLSQGVTRIAPWPDATKQWAAANPSRVQQLLWSNPRYVFFREEPLSDFDAAFGPRGALGVPLTPGRSIAVDKDSIPYGTPVWLSTPGPTVQLNRLVFAQDTGSAILGAVRADFFVGTGKEAGDLAAKLKQPLKLWALWPR